MLGSLLVGYDDTHGKDSAVLIIGKKLPRGTLDIINAFQGEEATELYKKLTTKKEKTNAEN